MPHTNIKRYIKHGTLPQLSVFEACARLGSFTRAAEQLHMAQPTVSGQIKKLTDTIGLPLFEQSGKRIVLTEPGRQLYAGCQDIFRDLASIEDSFAEIRGLKSGRLRLAASTTGEFFAPRLLAAFVRLHPGIEVSLQFHNRRTLIDRLADNEDDLYVFAHPPSGPEAVRQAILPNPLMVIARADDPLAREKRIPFARLAQEPFLAREPGSGTRMVMQELFDSHRLEPKIRMELNTNEAIRQAILAGLGVSILSRPTLGPDAGRQPLAALDVEGFPLEGYWYFVYPVGKQLSLVVRTFMEFARAEAKALVRDHLPARSRPDVRQCRIVAMTGSAK